MARLFHLCWQAARVNLAPGLALQGLALILVGAYYFLPASRPGFAPALKR